jgi:hypothetical protein
VQDLRSYVVKVYRKHAGSMAGTVQEVKTGRTVPFKTMEELWQAVRGTPARSGTAPSATRRATRCGCQGHDSNEPDRGGNSDEERD